ncbi:dihydrofolate reductase family protein [Nocardia vermiculata]|uniref:Dihydrofolate reductase n=1 Tax=Nocardia vermiculata TaxID=257274 RepID=A0A846XRD0_9NOCA|nr:dihydrofolate reductase family protein [Nocardia vermiculata]NKY49616.1 dihydrofolate reductase [Nocardia vermiculata]
MTGTVYYTATTLDGFIATPDHRLDWLLTRDVDNNGPMGYDDFITDIGAMAMGASTYQWIVDNEPEMAWPYSVPTWVFTHRTFPARSDGADIRFTRDPVPAVHRQMAAAADDRRSWIVGGGDLAGQFADHGLLDEVCVSIAPVTLGAGKPLLPRKVELRLTELAQNREFACARYDVVRDAG